MRTYILKSWITIFILTFSMGCATTLNVTYYSDPYGAILYEGPEKLGYASILTPVTQSYEIRDVDRDRGYMVLQAPTVHWVSGAYVSAPSIKASLSEGTELKFTFVRPNNFPGRDADERFADKLIKIELAFVDGQIKMLDKRISRYEPYQLSDDDYDRREQAARDRNDRLVFVCGSAGMGVDFVTGNCVSPSSGQVNPFNLYPPFQAPLPKPSNEELIMRCQGRAVDFVTGRCM